jgi:hypothetical protein
VFDRVSSINDLEVIMDDKMTFSEDVDVIRLSLEFRRDPYTLKSLYTSLVRPKLEYASCMWRPFYDVCVDRVERVQRLFIEMLCVVWIGRTCMICHHMRTDARIDFH